MKAIHLLAVAFVAAANAGRAQTMAPNTRYEVPATVSTEAAAQLKPIYHAFAQRPAMARPDSIADWDKRHAQMEAMFGPKSEQVAASLGVSVTPDKMGGVDVLVIRPAHYKPSGRRLLYLHGGGYVVFSARSALAAPALIAASGGEEVISIDYTVAPRGNWRSVTDQVLAVWQAVLASGIQPGSVGFMGDSAGGGLAAGSVLKMRDQGLPLPAALWMMSPWSDLTDAGDTTTTLAEADPVLNGPSLGMGADVYAPAPDQKNPYVSPIYGDYTKPFPPTLIQVGTREVLLSDAVRQYQAIRGGGHEAVLDVYEGMPHVFQSLIPHTPETRTAIARAVAFFDSKLNHDH